MTFGFFSHNSLINEQRAEGAQVSHNEIYTAQVFSSSVFKLKEPVTMRYLNTSPDHCLQARFAALWRIRKDWCKQEK